MKNFKSSPLYVVYKDSITCLLQTLTKIHILEIVVLTTLSFSINSLLIVETEVEATLFDVHGLSRSKDKVSTAP